MTMAKLREDIEALEKAILGQGPYPEDTNADTALEDLEQYRYVQDLWDEFGDIPMNPETECIERPFRPRYPDSDRIRETFPAGTHREDIWHWFEETFCLSVAVDLMY